MINFICSDIFTVVPPSTPESDQPGRRAATGVLSVPAVCAAMEATIQDSSLGPCVMPGTGFLQDQESPCNEFKSLEGNKGRSGSYKWSGSVAQIKSVGWICEETRHTVVFLELVMDCCGFHFASSNKNLIDRNASVPVCELDV